MKIYNRYILMVATLLLLTTVIMVALGQSSVTNFYIVYIMEALIVTELYVYLNAKARRGLNLISAILFGGFLVILSVRIIKILV